MNAAKGNSLAEKFPNLAKATEYDIPLRDIKMRIMHEKEAYAKNRNK